MIIVSSYGTDDAGWYEKLRRVSTSRAVVHVMATATSGMCINNSDAL
jgi:hypothetical protein